MRSTNVTIPMLPELFQRAKGTPRGSILFHNLDGTLQMEAVHTYNESHHPNAWVAIYVLASQYDDSPDPDEDNVRRALKGSCLRFVTDTYTNTSHDRWMFYEKAYCCSSAAALSASWDNVMMALMKAAATLSASWFVVLSWCSP